MATPESPQKKPYIIDENPGKRAWCACGRSQKQPYCDGSHKGTEFTPIVVDIAEAGQVLWCGCKHSGRKPYCDGSHSKL